MSHLFGSGVPSLQGRVKKQVSTGPLIICLPHVPFCLVVDLRPCPQKGVPGQRRQVAKRSVCGE